MLKQIPVSARILATFASISLAACLFGCSGTTSQQLPELKSAPSNKTIAVNWTDEFSMASLLADEVTISSQQDLVMLLAKPWYASVEVTSDGGASSFALESCQTYFSHKTPNLRAQAESEQNALRELEVMCEATRILSQAIPATQSYIPTHPLDADLPAQLPKSFALVTSQSELNRIKQDVSKTYWNEVNTITKVENPAEFRRLYLSDSGEQTLALLGSGDMNNDGQRDLLITLKGAVDGGSYINLRLFVITVQTNGNWQVVAQY